MKLQKPLIYWPNSTQRCAIDYLLASEGGICGDFNLSKCCLQIDDEAKVIEEITDRMRKIPNGPVQTWMEFQ
jgi:hypothetical protein